MWKNREKNLGTLKVGQKTTIEYIYEGELEVRNIVSSCGCTTADYVKPQGVKDKGYLIAQYVPRPIPQHIRRMGRDTYETKKTLTLYTDKGTMEVSFSATVKSK